MIVWARLDAFCLVPLSLRSAWRRRVAPTLNQKVENATLKNYSVVQPFITIRGLANKFGLGRVMSVNLEDSLT